MTIKKLNEEIESKYIEVCNLLKKAKDYKKYVNDDEIEDFNKEQVLSQINDMLDSMLQEAEYYFDEIKSIVKYDFESFVKMKRNELIDFIKKEDKTDNCFNVTIQVDDEEVYFEYQNRYEKTIAEAMERYDGCFDYEKYNIEESDDEEENEKTLLKFYKKNYIGYLYTTYGEEYSIFKQDLEGYKGKREEKLADFILNSI